MMTGIFVILSAAAGVVAGCFLYRRGLRDGWTMKAEGIFPEKQEQETKLSPEEEDLGRLLERIEAYDGMPEETK